MLDKYFENGVIVKILTIILFSKSRFSEGKSLFSPERRSKVVKFTKTDRFEAMIILADSGWFPPQFFALQNPIILLVFTCLSHLSFIIWLFNLINLTCLHTLTEFYPFQVLRQPYKYLAHNWLVVLAVAILGSWYLAILQVWSQFFSV